MKELWVPVSAAKAQQRYVDTLANNIANVNTAGFKRDTLAFKEYLTSLEKGADIDLPNKEWAPEDFYRSYGAEHAHVKVDGTYTDFSQGQLVPTQNPFDVAIKGEGFFEVLTPNGIRYSRKGNLSVDPEGFLVNEKGHKVLSHIELPKVENEDLLGAITQIPNPESRAIKIEGPIKQFSIGLDGSFEVNGQLINNLSIVEFKDKQALKREGGSYFINEDANNIRISGRSSQVMQGFVEQSNVNAIQEMSELIKASRHFENIQRAIKTYDNMAGKAYNEITKF
ncbi:MAG: flagellar hook-basal body protein [Bdellovibrio sp.]